MGAEPRESLRVVGWPLLILVAGIALVSAGHYLTPRSLFLWHNIFQKLYYLPIVFGAISYGWKGGLAAAAVSAACYIPHIIITWHADPQYMANQYAEVVLFFLVGAITGILADRERRHRAELERTTAELRRAHHELQQSFEQLKRAEQLSAVGQLAAALAHEIRNPLASIEGAADLVQRATPQDAPEQEFLSIIKKECRRLSGLLRNLLDLARARPVQLRPAAVRVVLDSAVGLAQPTAEQHRVQLVVDAPDTLPEIEADPEQLQQVLLNLTLNAIQAMPEGGTVRLAGRRVGEQVAIDVIDEGTGIPEEDLPKIFSPFYTTKPGGTGLGLAVAQQIVAQHGGTIEARRNATRGMTFTILLPLSGGYRHAAPHTGQ